MSEEILKALTLLFAIITKQDGGVTEEERDFVLNFFRSELDQDTVKEYEILYDKFSGYGDPAQAAPKSKATSVKDSLKTLALCKKINKTLEQKQKVVVMMKILEIAGSDNNITPQEQEIINTIASVFNISKEEHKDMERFIAAIKEGEFNGDNTLGITSETSSGGHFMLHGLVGQILVVRVPSVDMYFVKYLGEDSLQLNGFGMKSDRVYLFSHGSTIKTSHGDVLYYSDLVAYFNPQASQAKLSFYAQVDMLKFRNGDIGLRDIKVTEGPGKLVGIMGASGAGKTTLLNVLAGIVKPTHGEIRINGFDIHKEKDKIHGVIGYVSQDDLLIEELTVFENLYYNAKLCFANLSDTEINLKVMDILASLGLDQRKDLKVGSALDKTISGGQRKRLNIALELIREPEVLFVDEPTSGLSSRDSENVIDLLKELTLKGKLIFVVIHQPSSDIYKMFDKMFLMDVGGYPVYYGDPVEAVTYFKTVTNQIDRQRGQCEICGNVNPEQIFNIMDAKVVDEYGQKTTKRKINAQQWYENFKLNYRSDKFDEVSEQPVKTLSIPGKIKQSNIFARRDFLSKISNKQYLLINLLEGPILALILSFVIRYRNSPNGEEYIFRFNDNIPAFLMMAIVVALFMGLTVSAEEIISDRKILKRESFLNLSWNSYLMSKVLLLFLLSAIQSFTFVLIGNVVLEMDGMLLSHWFILFSCSAMANVLGLNISSAFNSAVTVYILIPLLLIPQMILSGLLFSFDKLNDSISTKGKVPIVADFMASRWAYEAMAVYQFMYNEYEAPYYNYEKQESILDFKSAFLNDKLEQKRRNIDRILPTTDDSLLAMVQNDLKIIRDNLEKEELYMVGIELVNLGEALSIEGFEEFNPTLREYLTKYKEFYQNRYNDAVQLKETNMLKLNRNDATVLNELKNQYFNESLNDLVKNVTETERIIEYDGRLIQQIDPIFLDPEPAGYFDYRAHFFAPKKHFMGMIFDTFYFNISVIWLMSLFFYVALYFEWLRKFLQFVSGFSIRRSK